MGLLADVARIESSDYKNGGIQAIGVISAFKLVAELCVVAFEVVEMSSDKGTSNLLAIGFIRTPARSSSAAISDARLHQQAAAPCTSSPQSFFPRAPTTFIQPVAQPFQSLFLHPSTKPRRHARLQEKTARR